MLKGSLELRIEREGLEASLEFSPDPEGPGWDRQKVYELLAQQGIREGIDSKALDGLLAAGPGGAGRRIVARGTAAEPGQPVRLAAENLSIPESLQPYTERIIPADRAPRVYMRTVEKAKRERTVTKKSRLPFLPDKEQTEVVWEKNESVTALDRPGEERGRGYAQKGDTIAVVSPGRRAKAGRDVLGKQIPAAEPEEEQGVYLGDALKQIGGEVRAETGGFYRYGGNWIELFPFSLHEHKVYASRDTLTCLLDFTPGSDEAVPPTAEQILEEAAALGFPPEDLLEVEQVAAVLGGALTDKTPLRAEPLSRSVDAQMEVTVSEDKLRALLSLGKGRGSGKPLRLKEVGDLIRSYRFRGMDIPRIQEEVLEFHRADKSRLENYLLVEGREAAAGEDGRIEWKISYLAEKRVAELKEQTADRTEQLAEFGSLQRFPIERVDKMAEVQERATVAEIVPASVGAAGVDVFGAVRPGTKGRDVQIELFENLKRIGNEIVATTGGLLDRGEIEGRIALRVRPHQDREIQLSLTEDRMRVFLTLLPSEGTGEPLAAEAVNRVIAEAGVSKGLHAEAIAGAVEAAQAGQKVQELLIAEGQEPQAGENTDLEILIHMASGQALTVRDDGRADYHSQDKITVVQAGALLARLRPPTPGVPGWDVTGKAIAARPGSTRYVHVGKHVDCREQEDGTLQYFAQIDGELDYRGSSIDVLKIHTVKGNVGLESGNVKFSGTVRVQGSVQSGFSVVSEESIFVEESVQGALLSAGDSIHIQKGIVGEGKAVLRAGKSFRARFAEQATLLAVEDIHLANACLRCTVKCNAKMTLESEKGNIIGGRVYCKLGLSAMNIGSEREVQTEIHFGQDILVQDHLEREQRRSDKLKRRNAEIDQSIARLKRSSPADQKALRQIEAEKLANLRQMEMHSKRIFILQERLEQHFPSEIAVRGVVFPGVVLKSHGRQREINTALREVVFYFNTTTGRIEEKPLNE